MGLSDTQYLRLIHIGTVSFVLTSLGLSLYFGFITAWIMAFVLQIVIGFISCYVLLLFMDYEDNMGYAAIDMSKQINPIEKIDIFLRIYQVLTLVAIGCYWILLLALPYLIYAARQLKLGRANVDPSRLWKDISRFKTAAQIRVAVNAVSFFLHLFLMLFSIVSVLNSTTKRGDI